MTAQKLVSRRKLAENYFKKVWKKEHQYAEEFGGYCVEQWLKNVKSRDRDLYYLGVDFLRQTVWAGNKPTNDIFLVRDRIYSERLKDRVFKGIECENTLLKEYEERGLFDLPELSQIDRAVLVLYYKWELNLAELGYVLGVGQSRACHYLTAAHKIVRKYVGRES